MLFSFANWRSAGRRQEFPELKEPDDTFSLFSLVMMLLGEYEEEKYKLGWQILKVSDVNWGGGSVIVQAVMFFDNVPTALKKRAEFSVDDLNRSFIYSRTAEQAREHRRPCDRIHA